MALRSSGVLLVCMATVSMLQADYYTEADSNCKDVTFDK
jgi:hypothetical protein